MDKYKLVERAKVTDSGRAASEDEVRVTSMGKTRNFVIYATSLLQVTNWWIRPAKLNVVFLGTCFRRFGE